jgi:Na+-driven multidrug efflux pump
MMMKSLKNINYRLFLSLLVIGFVPSVYTTVRIYFMGDFPGESAYSIAGQLSWVSLIFEVISETIILPLYFFIGQQKDNCGELINRIRTGLLMTFGVYAFLAVTLSLTAEPLLNLMAADKDIISESAVYIRIESFAMIFSTMVSFIFVVLVTIGKERYLYIFMGIRLVLSVVSDVFLVSSFTCSAQLGVNGIGISNILVNFVLLSAALLLLKGEGLSVFCRKMLSFNWVKDFIKIGGVSGLESLVRNFFYMIMIIRMVNAVSEQGTYWMANNFIWGWLLLPVIQLGELIKRDCGSDRISVERNSPGYFILTACICASWVITIPLWKPFMENVLNYADSEKLFHLVILLLPFYMCYAVQNVFDCTFYGLGKTHYILWQSVTTNVIYYGSAFVLYKMGVWSPTLEGIAILFGIGIAFDAAVSFLSYIILLKRTGLHIRMRKSKIDSAR